MRRPGKSKFTVERCHQLVAKAIKDGALIRPDQCEECASTGKPVEGAHYDYDEPLKVRWLCRSCHKKWDREVLKRREDDVFTYPSMSIRLPETVKRELEREAERHYATTGVRTSASAIALALIEQGLKNKKR